MAQINANLTNYDEQMGFDPLPPDWYDAIVADSEIKEGPKGNYILWTFEIIGKPNRIWDNMSLGNEVAMKRLKTMAVCCGHPNPNFIQDTDELHGKKCRVKLKIETDETGQYEPKNKITMFKPLSGTPNQNMATPAGTPNAHEIPAQQPKNAPKQQPMPWE